MSAIVIITSLQAISKSNGSPLANTGSPGDGLNNTCAKSGCHSGTINSFPGSVSIDVGNIPSSGYAPGATYSIEITVAESGKSTFGFQLTAEDGNNNKMGSYLPGSGVRLEFTNWITHSSSSSSGVWNIDWVAPSGTEDITFYTAGNAANGNGTSSGDHIYTSSVTVSRDLNVSVNDIKIEPEIEIFSVFSEKTLVVKSKRESGFDIYSISGQYLKSFHVNNGTTIINLSDLKAGHYIVLEEKGYFKSRFVIN